MRLILIFLAIVLFSCSSTEKLIVTKNHVLRDTLIKHEFKTIQLPSTKAIYFSNPCFENELVIPDRIIKDEKSTIKVTNDNGVLGIKLDIDSLVEIRVHEEKIRMESIKNTSNEVKIKKVKNKLNWWLVLYSIGATVFIFRKPIIGLIKKLVIPLPI